MWLKKLSETCEGNLRFCWSHLSYWNSIRVMKSEFDARVGILHYIWNPNCQAVDLFSIIQEIYKNRSLNIIAPGLQKCFFLYMQK